MNPGDRRSIGSAIGSARDAVRNARRARTLTVWTLVVGWIGWMAPMAPARGEVEDVIIVFKTHFDLGYTDMASNVLHRYRTSMIDDALKVVDLNRDLPADQQFVWTMAGWPLAQIASDWPGQTPARRERVLTAIREGRFAVHALPATLHTETLEPEELVRGLEFSSRLARSTGQALPRDAKMTDVPCHTWLLPTVLRRAGVDFLHLGCNAASRSPSVPSLFWWEGPDGSRLLTMYTAESYGTGLIPPPDWPYPAWLALIHTHDNHGPPAPDEVRKLLAEARARLPRARVRVGRLADFYDALLARSPRLPVVRGDMPDTWIHGPQCDPAGASKARRLRPLLEATEVLGTQLMWWGAGPVSDPVALVPAWEQSLLYGEHTWGGALWWAVNYSGGAKMPYGDSWRREAAAGRFARIESSWAEHTAYIERAEAVALPLLERELNALATAASVEGPRRAVFNPLPWPHSGWVAGKDGDGHWVREVPPLGYRVVPRDPTPAAREQRQPQAGAATLENRAFQLVLDPARGGAVSLIDRRSGRDWARNGDGPLLGQMLLERFSAEDTGRFVEAYVKIATDWATNELGKPNLPPSSEVPYRALFHRRATLEVRRSGGRVVGELKSPADADLPAVTTRWILDEEADHVDLEVTVHEVAPDPWPVALWVALPFRMDRPAFRIGRPGSIVDPATDLVPGSNQHLFTVQTGVALVESASGAGVGFSPLDSGLVSLGEPGCWKYSPTSIARSANAYVNVYNNQWTTNFRLWNGGTWTQRVRLWAFDRYDAEKSLVTPSLEARYPLLEGHARGPAGRLPASAAGLEASRRGVLVTALGTDPDAADGGLRLRVWELAGSAQPVRLRFPGSTSFPRADLVDLRGQALAGRPSLPLTNGWLELPPSPFAPTSVRLVPHASVP